MQVTILYFAQLREWRGMEKEVFECEETCSVGELFQRIFEKNISGIQFSVNQEFVSAEQLIEDGDEIAFLPPLGGG